MPLPSRINRPEARKISGTAADRVATTPQTGRTLYEDPLQFLWAVSYADLLMVLLSFFVIYFEMSNTIKSSPINEIIVKLSKTGTEGSGDGPSDGSKKQAAGEALESLKQAFSSNKINMEKDPSGRGVIIHFAEDIYAPGTYVMPADLGKQVIGVLEVIRPHKNAFDLTFIGHTDVKPVTQTEKRSHLIDSNLVLSNLRATRAVELAINQGFDSSLLSAKGMGEYGRMTRSLSLHVSERKSVEKKR